MCLYPQLIINPKYKPNGKNGGNIPPMTDPRVKWVPIGCQDCMECRKKKAREWQVRLYEDLKTHTNGKFVTFTLSNEDYADLYSEIPPEIDGMERENAIATLAVRYFLERWRKKYKTSLRHWLVTELGHEGTKNIHIHGIIWTNEDLKEVERKWQFGFMWKGKLIKGRTREQDKWVNYVNEKTVSYIIKYVNKLDYENKSFKSVILTSPGIGGAYHKSFNAKSNAYRAEQTRETYRTKTGHQISIPIYWRNKIYTDEQREKLWIQKLNKQERWVCGEKVKVHKSEEDYYKLLEYYRAKNTQLGYGDGTLSWDREQYERKKRQILAETRLQKAKQQYYEDQYTSHSMGP